MRVVGLLFAAWFTLAITTGGSLTIRSGEGDIRLIAPEIESGGETKILAEQGDIALLTNADSAFESFERNEEDLLWQSAEGSGFSETTRTPTRITAEGGLQILAGGQVIAEYVPTGGDFEAGIEQLAQSPGLAWMAELQELDNVACCLLYTSPSPRDISGSRMPSSA